MEREPEFEGSREEVSEFVLRFLLTQLLQDWRGPLMAVLLEALSDRLDVGKASGLLKIWDYTGIFGSVP